MDGSQAPLVRSPSVLNPMPTIEAQNKPQSFNSYNSQDSPPRYDLTLWQHDEWGQLSMCYRLADIYEANENSAYCYFHKDW
jgi:hypothetical protein